MKPIVLGATILTSLAFAAAASTLVSQTSPSSAKTKPAGAPTEAPSAVTSIAENGRPPVPIVRKRNPASLSATEVPPTPPASGQITGQGAPAVAMTELPPAPIDPRALTDVPVPNSGWGYPGPATSVPTVISRGKRDRYMFIPLDGQRILIVAPGRGFDHDEKEGKKEKRHRRGWE